MTRRTQLPVRLAATVLLLWSAAAFAVEAYRAFTGPAPGRGQPPNRWTLRSAPTRQLKVFLAQVDEHLPAGSVVAVAGPTGAGSADFFLTTWFAYFLPRHDVVRATQPWAWRSAEVLVVWETEPDAPHLARPAGASLELLFEHPRGAAFRVRR